MIIKKLQIYHPDILTSDIKDGHGVIAIFKGKKQGKNIAFRTDIDALPSGHRCGHDGHTAILLQFAEYIVSGNRPETGSIILIFQPEEETGNGAKKILQSKVLQNLHVDYIFGLHNLPGYHLGNILFKYGTFAAASTGFIAKLEGKQAHAAYPENGINPAKAVADFILALDSFKNDDISNFKQITVIHVNIGEIAFGTAAGDANVMLTLRSFTNKGMSELINNVTSELQQLANKYSLKVSYDFQDKFNALENDDVCVDIVKAAAKELNMTTESLPEPMRWSEDFADYCLKWHGGFFGIGSGENCKPLHNPEYNFPDELIDIGAKMFLKIAEQAMVD